MEMASSSTLDMLSNLPESMLNNILSRLSLRDMVRTTVLSTKWRYKWTSVPHLIFDDEYLPVYFGPFGHDKLVKIVNHVLLLHRGPVLTFEISSSQLRTCSEINSWILYLSFNSVKEFKLHISKSERHIVPPCLFSFGHLIQLILIGCIIVPPTTFKGFSYLKNLSLKKVTLSNASLECLLSSCPWLERLTLIDIDGPTHVEICNPNLKYLFFDDKSIGISLKDLRLLVYANLHAINVAHPDQQGTCNFTSILGSMLNIQKLVMKGWFLESLAIGDVPRRLPSTYDHLKSISFPLNMEDVKQILVAVCLLNSSPNLQELEILLCRNREYAIVPVMDLQEAKDQLECTFNKLRVVNMSKLFGIETELVLIKFILANSPVLETMSISPAKKGIELTLFKELLQFKRASPRAKIVYLDGSDPR
ncbi:F-box/FBD/LRR-repeat protein At1g13570-like isoform X2 [Macadamia integrifolia]|nr:F-box/FBD/LRR-repeat protein At1g13570-like isoform X2 [Macadamia integrifolia]